MASYPPWRSHQDLLHRMLGLFCLNRERWCLSRITQRGTERELEPLPSFFLASSSSPFFSFFFWWVVVVAFFSFLKFKFSLFGVRITLK